MRIFAKIARKYCETGVIYSSGGDILPHRHTSALVGNPNCGKTALFNRLTGGTERVGNFPGVTVAKRAGTLVGATDYELIDLPGTYSLSPFTPEERAARDFLASEPPELIINVSDASNPERGLYLTTQLLELGIPVVIALNMADELRSSGGSVDTERLSELLGAPVLTVSAATGENLDELARLAASDVPKPAFAPELHYIMKDARRRADVQGADRDAIIAGARYDFVELAVSRCFVKGESRSRRRSRRIDAVLTHRVFALPALAVITALTLFLSFSIGNALSHGAEKLLALASGALRVALSGAPELLRSFVCDGLVAGVGSVLSFLPTVLALFLALSLLEDTGYLARMAFVTDGAFRRVGLSGRCAAPFLTGFGCTVPAIAACRAVSGGRERKITALLAPMMSCGAKAPVYAAFAAAIFPGRSAVIAASLYLLGILLAFASAAVINKLAGTRPDGTFILELPDYRLPSPRSTLALLRSRTKDYLTRAFTAVYLASVAVWALGRLTPSFAPASGASDSILAWLGGALAPVFAPLGFGTWYAAASLAAGIAAKEASLAVLASILGGTAALSGAFTPAGAAAYLVFLLLYCPCAASLDAIRRELGFGYAVLSAAFQTALAWLVSGLAYRLAVYFISFTALPSM